MKYLESSILKEQLVKFPIASMFIAGLVFASVVQAQEPALPRPPPAPPLPLLFKEAWKETPAAVPLTQEAVTNADLALTVYGAAPEVNSEGGTPHVWTGLCSPACAI